MAKKPERATPAPNVYASADRTKHMMPSPFSQKCSKEKRIGIIDHIMIEEKKKVAPNAYKAEKSLDYCYKPKVTGVYLG